MKKNASCFSQWSEKINLISAGHNTIEKLFFLRQPKISTPKVADIARGVAFLLFTAENNLKVVEFTPLEVNGDDRLWSSRERPSSEMVLAMLKINDNKNWTTKLTPSP